MVIKRRPRTLSTTSSWFLALAVVMLAFLLHFYGHVLQSPNSVLLTSDGDGLKNYFTYAWHVEYDPTSCITADPDILTVSMCSSRTAIRC